MRPQLERRRARLDGGAASGRDSVRAGARPWRRCHARYHWVDGSAYVNHVELVRKARNAEMPPSFWTDPLVYQGGSDDLLGPMDDVPVASEEFGIDLEAEVAVITDDVPMATSAAEAGSHIKLLMLVNDWSLRNLIPGRTRQGFRLLPVEAGDGVFAVRRDAGRTRRRMARAARCTCRSSRTSTGSCSASPMPAST